MRFPCTSVMSWSHFISVVTSAAEDRIRELRPRLTNDEVNKLSGHLAYEAFYQNSAACDALLELMLSHIDDELIPVTDLDKEITNIRDKTRVEPEAPVLVKPTR